MKTRRYLLLPALLLSLCSLQLSAQFFSTGQDPSSIHWEQLRTRNFTILYDRDMQAEAIRLSQLMESYRLAASHSLDVEPRPISIVVHNHSVTSNAIVAIAPRRLELYPLAPQDSYAQPWLRQLSIHEYRHVAQYETMNRGFTRGLSWVFGEQATALVMGAYLPFWYIEGDATVTETALSSAGRGRLPDFIAPVRAQMLEQGIYSYDKAAFGSYRSYVPNRYAYGYHLVGMTRMYYGTGVWEHALDRIARRPWMIIPFSTALHDSTGMGKARLHKAMSDSLLRFWDEARTGQDITPREVLPHRKRNVYTDYRYPFPQADGSIIALRSGLGDIKRFVRIDSSGREKVIHTPGTVFTEGISSNGNFVVWAEDEPDLRWENRSFGNIWMLDTHTGKARRLTHGTRYFAPAISHNGNWIAVSHTTVTNRQQLIILNARTGEIVHRREHPDNRQFITPSWSEDDRMIVVVTMGDDGKSIEVMDPLLGTFERVLPAGSYEFRQPLMRHDTVFYTDGLGGVRNLYAVHRYVGMIYMLTSSEFGMTDAFLDPDGKGIYYSEYSSQGFSPVKANLDELKITGLPSHNNFSLQLADVLSAQENFDRFSEADTFRYEMKRYRPALHMLNPHSWGPISVNASTQSVSPGFSLNSQDLLGTTFFEAGWEYDVNRQKGTWYADLSYRRYFPVFDLRWSTTEREGTYLSANGKEIPFYWNEINYRAGVLLPLNLDRAGWFRRLQPSVRYSRIALQPFEGTPDWIPLGFVNSFDYSLYMVNQQRSSLRDFRPRWRQSLTLNYRHSPAGEKSLGSIGSAWLNLYFPGVGRHHSLRLDLAAQRREQGSSLYGYSSLIPIPRGTHGISQDSMLYASISYGLPLLYPDLSLGPVAYIKRVKGVFFLDNLKGWDQGISRTWQSVGLELTVDGHFLRFLAPIEAGVRMSYILQQNAPEYELIFSIDFDGF